MARFHAEDAKNYGGQGGGGFFTLQDDGDTARVRFMYDSVDDVEGLSVHKVQVGTRPNGRPLEKYVNCLREYNDPVDKCPFCAAHKPVLAKLFIPIYDVESKDTKTWERGKKFFGKMTSLCSRYKHPVSRVFEIERNGAKGDKETTYEIYPIDDGYDENLNVEDLPAKPSVMGTLVLDKSADDMNYYLEHGSFPSDGNDDNDFKPRRRGGEERTRRTPSGEYTERRRHYDDNEEEAF